MKKTRKQKNVVSMLSGFAGDIVTFAEYGYTSKTWLIRIFMTTEHSNQFSYKI